jgi:hypothetical protein
MNLTKQTVVIKNKFVIRKLLLEARLTKILLPVLKLFVRSLQSYLQNHRHFVSKSRVISSSVKSSSVQLEPRADRWQRTCAITMRNGAST